MIQAHEFIRLPNGSTTEDIWACRLPSGLWASCYTTWCAVTFRSRKTSKSSAPSWIFLRLARDINSFLVNAKIWSEICWNTRHPTGRVSNKSYLIRGSTQKWKWPKSTMLHQQTVSMPWTHLQRRRGNPALRVSSRCRHLVAPLSLWVALCRTRWLLPHRQPLLRGTVWRKKSIYSTVNSPWKPSFTTKENGITITSLFIWHQSSADPRLFYPIAVDDLHTSTHRSQRCQWTKDLFRLVPQFFWYQSNSQKKFGKKERKKELSPSSCMKSSLRKLKKTKQLSLTSQAKMTADFSLRVRQSYRHPSDIYVSV